MMKTILKPGSIAFGFGLRLTRLGQAQQGAPSGTPLTFKVAPNALSAISFSAAPNVQCSVAPANGSGQAFTVYTNDEGTATILALREKRYTGAKTSTFKRKLLGYWCPTDASYEPCALRGASRTQKLSAPRRWRQRSAFRAAVSCYLPVQLWLRPNPSSFALTNSRIHDGK